MKQLLLLFCFSLWACAKEIKVAEKKSLSKQYLTVLGISQDAGYPHIGCQKKCCTNFYKGIYKKQKVVSLGLVDIENKQKWLFEATPDIATQLAILEQNHLKTAHLIDGIFLTHAHIGHYSGLMFFGKEALGKKGTNVFAMPKMKAYLTINGPWSQLVKLKNIVINELKNNTAIVLNNKLKVTPFLVPHRDEFSETVGYRIEGPHKTALFIPDINKWENWEKSVIEEVKKVDYAFLDATFFKEGEINRPMAEIPHPFVEETMDLFKHESIFVKNKIYFIHFNHTNPAMQVLSHEKNIAQRFGFNFATENMKIDL
jgi:pyrroloquinoline quinone biosynthesis protein B